MATRLKPIAHEDRLSLIEHLDELRTRVIICVATFVVVGGICLWQDDTSSGSSTSRSRRLANTKPCDETRDPLEQADCWQQAQKRVNEQIAATAGALARSAGDDAALRAQAEELERVGGRGGRRRRRGRPRSGPSRSASASR